ncbi:FAD-dependent oxidoreductase [Acrocarpospora macrocephala]|uniref:Ferredoxin reductase n=1 Tax=Acrocarpospora macrocephala TaxID=150177 RepID=A0A5M3WPB5_9ACTN|nr:FAD-dependent oxidoreductase [Acrocarpospora macrocephala]GES09071.1 ferredoxin reductase [Acrocarpospora macrocephala]
MTPPRAAVIAGASAAGLAAADGLRDGGWTGTITVLGEERRPPYDRTMLSKGLLVQPAAQPLPLRTPEQLAERGIDLQVGHAARGLDIDRRLVVTGDGGVLPYDALILATGSRPRTMTTVDGLPLPGLGTVEDLELLRDLVDAARTVTLIGTGFISLEIAAALRARHVQVTVLGADTLPLAGCLGDQVARWLWDQHRTHGVDGHLGRKVISVGGGPGDFLVHLEDGSVHHGDVALAGIGVVPCDEWLIGSGVRRRGGVLCDAAGRTGVPDVWAAGDLARTDGESPGQTLGFGHWTNAVEQGRNVGLNVARGEANAYHGPRTFWTEQYGHTIRSIGTREPGDLDETVEGDVASGEFVVLHHGRDGTWHGVTACRRDRALRGYRRLLLARAPLADAHALARQQLSSPTS